MKIPYITATIDELGPNARAMLNNAGLRGPPRLAMERQLDIVRAVILRRRQPCYGSLAITLDQADEMARAIVSNIAAEIAGG
jgi:hypothetical protein